MKKIKLLLGFLLLLNCQLMAQICPSLEVRTAAFFHNSSLFTNIYGTAPCYELQLGLGIFDWCELWVNFDWSPKNGKSEGLEDRTKSNIYNLSAGVICPFNVCSCFTPYLGVGASLSELHLKNESSCCGCNPSACVGCTERSKKFTGGIILKSGIYFCFDDCFFENAIVEHCYLDLFVDYLYQPIHFEEVENIGGLKVGIGIGFWL